MPAGANKSPVRNLTPDGEYIGLGKENDGAIGYDRTDANAGVMKISLPAGAGGGVPVVAVGVNIDALDLGTSGPDFASFTQPMVATVDLDRDSYVGFHFSSDDVAVVRLRLANGTVRNHTIPDVASDTFAMLAATQTLSNKTLTTGTLTTPTISSGTLTSVTLNSATYDTVSAVNMEANGIHPGGIPFVVGGWTTAVSGSGSVSFSSVRILNLQTGASASGTALARTPARNGWHQGQVNQAINFSKRIELNMMVSVIATANATARIYLGGAGTVAALGSKSFGVLFTNNNVYGIAHDGGSAVESTLSYAMTGTNSHRIRIISYGNGTVEWRINGTALGSVTVGPTGSGGAGFDGIQVDVQNGTAASNYQLNLHQISPFFEQ